MDREISIKFLGTRSLHSCPSKENIEFGGNVECIALSDSQNTIFINASFAINSLGDQLQKQSLAAKTNQSSDIFLTDFLWEHILGIPFYAPIHFKNNEIKVYSPLEPLHAKDWLNNACKLDFSPFNGIESLRSNIHFLSPSRILNIGMWEIEAILTESPLTPYPVAIWCFKHKAGVKIAVSGHRISSPLEQTRISKLLDGYNCIIQSAASTSHDNPTTEGRSTFQEAAKFCNLVNSDIFIIQGFHPRYNDENLKELEKTFKLKVVGNKSVLFAREDHEFSIQGKKILGKVG